jgi:tRNA pseudouridine38-40 synthase
MWKYAALLSYIGTNYCGWQRQRGSAAGKYPSIQATLEDALLQMTGEEKVSLVGSGRTDSGVHAIGQVAHFVLQKKHWSPEILKKGLNALLPSNIQVLAVASVELDFHAQRSADKKQYSYYFQQGPCAIPCFEPYSWWIRKSLDLGAMQKALDHLQGRQDFKPFQASGAKPVPTVREILEAEVSKIGLVRVRIVGTGFLKQMVRGIAGTLLQVGEGRRSADCTLEILESGDRSRVGPTAPARALWLERVWYTGLEW